MVLGKWYKKEITSFVDGQQEGLWITWYEDGTKKSERKFTNGERDSVWTTWYEDGNKSSRHPIQMVN